MHLDVTTPTGQAWIADYLDPLNPAYTASDVLHDHAFHCDECDAAFSEAKDVGYGDDGERLCLDCANSLAADAAAGRRYGEAA